MVPLISPTCRCAVRQSLGQIRFLLPDPCHIAIVAYIVQPCSHVKHLSQICAPLKDCHSQLFPTSPMQNKHPSLEEAWWLGVDESWQPMLPSRLCQSFPEEDTARNLFFKQTWSTFGQGFMAKHWLVCYMAEASAVLSEVVGRLKRKSSTWGHLSSYWQKHLFSSWSCLCV